MSTLSQGLQDCAQLHSLWWFQIVVKLHRFVPEAFLLVWERNHSAKLQAKVSTLGEV